MTYLKMFPFRAGKGRMVGERGASRSDAPSVLFRIIDDSMSDMTKNECQCVCRESVVNMFCISQERTRDEKNKSTTTIIIIIIVKYINRESSRVLLLSMCMLVRRVVVLGRKFESALFFFFQFMDT